MDSKESNTSLPSSISTICKKRYGVSVLSVNGKSKRQAKHRVATMEPQAARRKLEGRLQQNVFEGKTLHPKSKSCLEATPLKVCLQQTREKLSELREMDERDVDRDSTSRNGGSSAKRNDRIKEKRYRKRVLGWENT